MKKIILRHTHERDMSGCVTMVEEGAKTLEIPMFCGCVAVFALAPDRTEKDTDNCDMEVWKQIDFKFNEYHSL